MLLTSILLLSLSTSAALHVAARPEVVSYGLWLEVEPESREIRGKASVDVISLGGDLEAIQFSLNEHLKIASLHVDDRKVNARRGDRIAEGRGWLVPLKPSLTFGETRAITFEYHGTGIDPGQKDSDWMVILLVREDETRMSHQSQWYPIVPLDERARAGKQRVRVLAFPDHLEGAKTWGSEAAEAIGVLEYVFGKLAPIGRGGR